MEHKQNDVCPESPQFKMTNYMSPILPRKNLKEEDKKLEESLSLSFTLHKFDESSSSSSENLSDKELKFEDVELNLGDVSNAPTKQHDFKHLKRLFSKIDTSSIDARSRVGRQRSGDDEGWESLFSKNHGASKSVAAEEATKVRIFDLNSKCYQENTTKEIAIQEYKKGRELVVEIMNYKIEDATYLIKQLNLNAILCWEIMEEQAPDKFEKYGSRTFFVFLNFLTVASIGSSEQHSIKIVKIPRLILLFSNGKFDLKELNPNSIENLTSDKILFLILQYSMQQIEDVLTVLKLRTNEIYELTHESKALDKTKVEFVQDIGRLSTLILSLKQQVHRKKILFSEVTRERSVFPLLRYLVRHLHGRLRYCKAEINDMNLLLDVTQNTHSAAMDQKVTEYNSSLNNMTRVLSTIVAIYGPMTIIGGIMGMNVKLPGNEDTTYLSFILILVVSAVLSIILLLVFKYTWDNE